jgi:hypothetical protein
MTQGDLFLLVGMGGAFILLGIVAILWGRREEKGYYNSLTARSDAREFLEHWPRRPQFGAITVGGWIAVAIGVVMAVMGSAFYLWG